MRNPFRPNRSAIVESLPFDDSLIVQEQIGKAARPVLRQTSPVFRSFQDISQADYAYWDKLRRGQAKGMELSGLLQKAVTDKETAWVLGRPPLWQTTNDSINEELNAWWTKHHPSFIRAYHEALDLGDCYIVMNGDSSVTVIPPDAVTPLVDADNPSRWIGWRITTTAPHPTETGKSVTIIDEYTATKRVQWIKTGNSTYLNNREGGTTYLNPLGRVPVIHVANRKGSDERFGRPECDSLVNWYIRYGDVLDAALKGNIRQGRPTPVIQHMGSRTSVNEFWERYGRREQVATVDGGTESILVIDFDLDQLLTLSDEAEFAYAAPGSFSQDTLNLLEVLFYLYLQHTGIPEFLMGNAIGSSKASAEAQLEPFLKFIDMKRGEAQAWIDQVAQLFVAWVGTFNRRARNLVPVALWRPMASGDGRLTLDSVIWAWSKGFMDDEMALWLLPLNINDAKLFLERVKRIGLSPHQQAAQDLAVAAADTAENAASGAVPASGGGEQGRFTKQENPRQPTETERAMTSEELDRIVSEVADRLNNGIRSNGKVAIA